ncbi:MAG: hypothetical protein JWN27_4515 [Candidatus Eremiobacteraeota bacterium]|nr:hypothetical protein [Candidatus Eremiobacteraeota bacterium]
MHVHGIDANYYTVQDTDTLTKFYAAFLGEPATHMPGRISEWTFADGTSFGLYGTDGASAGTSGSVMFAVDDVARAVEECKALGVHFHEDGEVTDTPACRMAFGEDPEGNQFILHKRKAG